MALILNGVRIISVMGTIFDFKFNKTMASAKYTIKTIEGIGPPDFTVHLTPRSTDGSLYSGRRSTSRRIVMNVGFQPDYSLGETVGTLRQNLYELLDNRDGATVKVELRDAAVPAGIYYTSGYVSKMEPNIFSKEAEMQITIDCPSPHLLVPTTTTLNPASIANLSITNPGDIEVGFYMQWQAAANHTSFRLYRSTPWPVDLYIAFVFQTNDTVQINTTQGVRSVKLIRAGVTTNLLKYLTAESDFFQLYPGTNNFTYPGTSTNVKNISIQYSPRYWGV